mmetsp:Transcript_3998/g.5888  ORF Transcript_3998/g.5888 Transcript_3998/m.5888 type:complete len:113 (-) Transcript_3998:18-356(-)
MLFSNISLELNHWFTCLVTDDTVREQLFVFLYGSIVVFASDKTLDIKESPWWIRWGLVLGRITNQSCTIFTEGDVRWGDAVSLFVSTNIHSIVSPYCYAAVSSSKINTNTWS